MQCPNCRREAVDNAVFCNHCGTQLQNICINCNSFNPLDSNFCNRCGSSLSADSQRTDTPAYQEPPPSSTFHSTMCPRCHKVNEHGSAYCYSCGLPLDEVTASPQHSYTPASQYSHRISTQGNYQAQVSVGQLAGFWIRLVAALVDGIILISLTLILVGALPGVSVSEYLGNFSFDLDSEATTPLWFDALDVALNAMYSTVLVWIWSATVGKLIFGLQVVRADGSKVGFGRALARFFCYFLSLLTLGIGFLMIAFRQDKRGLHDLICDTIVVRR